MRYFKENPIRKLAGSNHWQTLYTMAKELNGIQLFDNTKDLSRFQIIFLQWLQLYNSLYIDLSSGKNHLSEERIKDEILCDAYLYYRKKRQENKLYDEQEKKKKKKGNKTKLPSVKFT